MIGRLRRLLPASPRGGGLCPDLDARDPDYIRERLPGLWLLSSLYFRGDVRGLGNIPDHGPVLMVGNHSGGGVTPDTLVLVASFSTYFGVERPVFALTGHATLNWPPSGFMRRFGIVPAAEDAIDIGLDLGAAVLTYPGGDRELHRPSWERATVDLGDDTAWVTSALRRRVPVIPVVSVGGQETALFLGRSETLARLPGVHRLTGREALPLSLSFPWGLSVGGMTAHVPLPAKLTIEALPPIDLAERYGADPDPAAIRDDIAALMQRTLASMQRDRRLPVIG